MSFSYHLTVGFVSLILLSACESDESKMGRLRGDQAAYCGLAEKYGREYEMVAVQVRTPLQDSLKREASNYGIQCDLATRELNRFMR
jgi:hypothetical protein